MNLITSILFIIALTLTIVIPFAYFLLGKQSKKRYKKTLFMNVAAAAVVVIAAAIVTLSPAEAAAAEETVEAASSAAGLGYIGAALSVGLSCLGGGIAVSSAASAALGAISEDSSVLGKSLIFVGLAEGVCLYGLIIAFMIISRL
ncbi:MAG: ATP synthase subunit C [Lachnospiraceae bacterium]